MKLPLDANHVVHVIRWSSAGLLSNQSLLKNKIPLLNDMQSYLNPLRVYCSYLMQACTKQPKKKRSVLKQNCAGVGCELPNRLQSGLKGEMTRLHRDWSPPAKHIKP